MLLLRSPRVTWTSSTHDIRVRRATETNRRRSARSRPGGRIHDESGLLPFVSRYRLVPLGALAAQWPADELSLTIDGSSEHRLTLTSEGVRTLLARP